LGAKAVEKFLIRLHVYPEPKLAGEEGLWRVNPLLYPERRSRWERRTIDDAIKRGLDVVGSLTLLVMLSPLLLLVAAMVRLSSRGPVFFRQVRIGQMMKPFMMLKFRTMYMNADHRPHHEFVSRFIKASGQVQEPGNNRFFKLTNDPRVTPVGRVLRKTSFDELPQLWNVLRGGMSLVGPRPPLPYELEQYKPWHRRRVLEAKPGITGLWQVAGRSRTTFDEMVRLDLRYARTRSLWNDLKILMATPAAVISGKGAC
jgi:lipopolysaccharide/colanic/teichoic acid biosynthesis glycosyltransferase